MKARPLLRQAIDLLMSQRLWREAAAAGQVLADELTSAGRESEAAETRSRLERELLPHLEETVPRRTLRLPVRSPA